MSISLRISLEEDIHLLKINPKEYQMNLHILPACIYS